jgi:tRNA(Arg) A34 adenosine deaminase TadA
MCLGAIYWARPDVVYFANTRKDAAEIGFDDSMIYDEINAKMEERKIPLINLQSENAKEIFHKWKEKNDKTIY